MTRREELEQAIETAIAVLDAMDGDCDLEAEPDGEDSFDREQDWCQRSLLNLAGVPGETYFLGRLRA